MMRVLAVLLVLSLVSTDLSAQSKSGYKIQNADRSRKNYKNSGGGDFFDRVYIQPNFGLSFGSNQVFWELSPTFGYRITDDWDAGLGFSYTFSKTEVPGTVHFRANTIGGNLFTRYIVADPVFLMVRYELLGTKFDILDSGIPATTDESRNYFGALLAGGGIMQPIGNNGAIVISVLYNLTYDDSDRLRNGPYTSPVVINTGIMIGL